MIGEQFEVAAATHQSKGLVVVQVEESCPGDASIRGW